MTGLDWLVAACAAVGLVLLSVRLFADRDTTTDTSTD